MDFKVTLDIYGSPYGYVSPHMVILYINTDTTTYFI